MAEPQAKIRKLTATVEHFKRTEELLTIKRSEEDQTPIRLTVNKRVSPIIKGLLSDL